MKKILAELNKNINDVEKLDPVEYPFKLSERAKINIGYKCNARCHFCYYHKVLDAHLFSLDLIEGQLKEFKEYGIKDVDFSGGEPTIHPKLPEMISMAEKMGFRKICVISNGIRFSDIDLMKKCFDKGMNDVLFSLHGDSDINDSIMGVKGSFLKCVTSIQNANEIGIKPRVNTVISKISYKNLPKLGKIINSLPVFNHNIIGFRHCYYKVGAGDKDTVSHSEMSPYLVECLSHEKNIEFLNVRYVPFCFAIGYEKHMTNYPQKMYDPLEWNNALLFFIDYNKDAKFCKFDYDRQCDKTEMNNRGVNSNRFLYKKTEKCMKCKNLLICDGFEEDYLRKYNAEEEANLYEGETIKDPLYYRKEYYKEIYQKL